MRIIGDVHGLWRPYVKIASKAPMSLQVGDMGFDYSFFTRTDLSPENHRFIGGNHDNYPALVHCPHSLHSYGTWENIFYVRGAWSIDHKMRTAGIDWWPEEEISIALHKHILGYYKQCKPETVVSHDGPIEAWGHTTNPDFPIRFGHDTENGIIPTRTTTLFEKMLEIHRPKLWIFGHHHRLIVEQNQGTQFICLPELSWIDI